MRGLLFRLIVLVGIATVGLAVSVPVDSSPGSHRDVHAMTLGGQTLDSHDHWDPSRLASVPSTSAVPKNDPSGQRGSGDRAVAFFPSGRPVPGKLRSRAPDARLFQTGVNALEPTIGIDHAGNLFFIGVEGDRWPSFPTQTVRSSDEGRTWKVITPSVGDQSRHPYTEDPYLYLDEDTDRVFTSDYLLPCTELSFSDDKGKTWTTTVMACDLFDHQTIFTGPPVTSSLGQYPNVVYYCAIDGGAANASTASSCLKSIDGGETFVRTGAPAFVDDPSGEQSESGVPGDCIGATGHGVAGKDGTVYLPRGWCGQPYLAISKDEGFSWRRVQISDIGMGFGGGRLDHDAAIAVDDKNNLYYSWTAADLKPYLSVSTDGGKTWSKPIMVAPPGVKIATLIALDVTTPGKLAMSFIGSEKKAQFGTNEYNGYMMMTTDALSKDPLFYATTVNERGDPIESVCSTGSCRVNREFIDVAIAPDGTVWAPFVDGCFNGSCDHNGRFLGIGHGIVGRLVGGPSLR